MKSSQLPKILWQPAEDQRANAQLTAFAAVVDNAWAKNFDYASLYEWSVRHTEEFWSNVANYCELQFSKQPTSVINNGEQMPGARWFEGSLLNYAQNLLRYNDDNVALIFWGEDKIRRSITYRELNEKVACIAAALKEMGVGTGDRVAAIIPNCPEAIIGMLATSSLGGIWSSCSPDFGVDGILDRFGQIEPKILIACDGYFFKGKSISILDKLKDVQTRLPALEKMLITSYLGDFSAEHSPHAAVSFETLLEKKVAALQFTQLPFSHPLYIMYSSGTTGKPKCIVHSQGGTLIEHLKELILHTDLRRTDVIFYGTTCSWMMWNWLVSSLAVGATLALYDGFPLHHEGKILFDMAEKEGITIFGTSAGYISAVSKTGMTPRHSHNLSALRSMLSTGSPLAPESFDFVYSSIKSDLCLSSISGGTDILGCFALGNPWLPVYRGELQCRSLGLAVDVFNDGGSSIRNEQGELVCTKPFPSMPVGFWNDADGSKYRSAYFECFPNIWHHGDFVELTDRGTMIFYGRSDAVLNPGGVRIGTSEIYRQLETIQEIASSVAVGQQWKNEERIILFVKLREGVSLDDALRARITESMRKNASPRHVPRKIIQVEDIPITRSGKISELAVKEVLHGRAVKNLEALANPHSLEFFKNVVDLSSD